MRRICWFIPIVKQGSGGLRTVLAHAAALENKGFHITLRTEDREGDAQEAKRKIADYYGYGFTDVRVGWENTEQCDMAIATVWSSAHPVANLPPQTKKLYYVQDFEPWFYPAGSMYLAAEASYTLGLPALTIGRFLARKLGREYKIRTAFHDFGADGHIYRPLENARATERSVCFLFQPGKERRAAELGLAALEIVAAMRPGVSIHLFGSAPAKTVAFKAPFVFRGFLSPEECNELYSRSTVGLSLSCTNPSRVPFEMMASGLPVVDLHRENTVYDFPEEAMFLARQTPQDLAFGLVRILDDPGRQDAMRKAGLSFMRHRSAAMEIKAFGGIIKSWFDTGVFPEARECQPLYRKHIEARI